MGKVSPQNKKQVKELSTKLTQLQSELVLAKKLAGDDMHIEVKVRGSRTRFTRVSIEAGPDKGFGQFTLTLAITAKQATVYMPLSVASGIRTAGFMYQIEGTTAGAIKTTTLTCEGSGVTQVAVGTLLYAKIAPGATALCTIDATVRGQVAQTYKIVITRINYKLNVTDARYQQYLKPLESKSLRFA
jgi:hypothetical protein